MSVAPRVVKTFLGAHTIPLEFKELGDVIGRKKYVDDVVTKQIPAVVA